MKLRFVLFLTGIMMMVGPAMAENQVVMRRPGSGCRVPPIRGCF